MPRRANPCCAMLLFYVAVLCCCAMLLCYVVTVLCCCSMLLFYVVAVLCYCAMLLFYVAVLCCCCSMLLFYVAVLCCCCSMLLFYVACISSRFLFPVWRLEIWLHLWDYVLNLTSFGSPVILVRRYCLTVTGVKQYKFEFCFMFPYSFSPAPTLYQILQVIGLFSLFHPLQGRILSLVSHRFPA